MSNFVFTDGIVRDVTDYCNNKRYSEDGTIVLMCPCCLHMTKINVSILNVIGSHKINNFYIETKYNGECSNCNEYVEFECIDINMAEIIEILNSKGYYTAFSCEGHIESDIITGKDVFSNPYIYFYFWEDSEILKDYPLPKTWKLPEDHAKCARFSIYDNIEDIIPDEIKSNDSDNFIMWLYNNWDKENRLKDIYDWAVSLPDRDEEFKKSRLDLSKTYGNMLLLNNSDRYIETHKKISSL